MSAALDTRAEIAKLARLLGVEPDTLGFLDVAGAADLVTFREQVTDSMYAGGGTALARLAAGSRLLPGAIAATIAQRAMGPLLCARLAGLVEPAKAIEVARHLQAPFLSDVAVQVDPRRAREVIGRVPAAVVAEVGGELDRRGEHVAMGRFVGYLGDEALTAALGSISDPGLLQIGFVMEGKERLDHVLGLVAAARLTRLIRAAAEFDLWPEALDLLGYVSPARLTELGDIVAAEDDLLDSLARAVDDQGLWDAMLSIVPSLSHNAQDRVAAMAARLDRSILDRVIAAVHTNDLWAVFVPLAADHMDGAGRERVAIVAADVDEDTLLGLADAVERDGLWPQLLTIAAEMDPRQLERIAARLLSTGLEQRLPALISAIEQTDLWETGLTLLVTLPESLQHALAAPTASLPAQDRARVLGHAENLGLLAGLGPLYAALTQNG